MTSNRIRQCKDHPTVDAIARCTSCRRLLCNACYRFRIGEDPVCARCVYETETRPQRRISLASAFVSLVYGGGFVLARRYDLWEGYGGELIFGAVVALAVAIFIGLSGRAKDAPNVERRELEEEVGESALDLRGSPYRAGVRRIVQAASPRLSGRLTVLVVGLSLASCAVILPASLKLPHWVELELVLAAWWVLLTGTLVGLLHRGFRLADDWVYFAPWDRGGAKDGPSSESGESVSTPGKKKRGKKGKSSSRDSSTGWLSGCGDVGCSGADAGEGAIALIGIAVALAIAFGAAWILVEIAMPLVFFLVYWVLMKAIGRVANDRHECKGHFGRSLVWGAVWSTLYLVPLSLLTFVVHRALPVAVPAPGSPTTIIAPR